MYPAPINKRDFKKNSKKILKIENIFVYLHPIRTKQVLKKIPTKVEEVNIVEESPSQHRRIKGTISRAEVIGARDNKR